MKISELYQVFLKHPVVTTDTRDCPKNSMFFALRGASFNGNDFAIKALESGCAYAVVDDERVVGDERLIHVPDVLTAMQELAAYHRQQLHTPILQVTGTNGKTTTKELTSAVLSERFNVLYTLGNFNNHIGVPKTLLRLRPEHDIAVVETGANHPGEIAELCRIVQADCGLITNVGKAHLEGFGSFEGVIHTKGELYDDLRQRPDTFIFLNADNEHLVKIAGGLKAVTYGEPGKGYDVEGEVVSCTPFVNLRWRQKGGEWQEIHTHLIGAYNVTNMLAAATIGLYFGVTPEQINHALETYTPSNNRSQLEVTADNRLIVDAYNANPTSMAAALTNFEAMHDGHKMAIIGDMKELGSVSHEEHQKIVDQLKTMHLEQVWLVGQEFEHCDTPDTFRLFENVNEVKEAIKAGKPTGQYILIKGSNGTRLFELPELL